MNVNEELNRIDYYFEHTPNDKIKIDLERAGFGKRSSENALEMVVDCVQDSTMYDTNVTIVTNKEIAVYSDFVTPLPVAA